MSISVLLFEAALACMIGALIYYCIKLNRRLEGIREKDEQITAMIASFVAVSERAEASVAQMKAAGIAAERSVRAAIVDAEAVRGELVRHAALGPVTAVVNKTVSRPASHSPDPDVEATFFAPEDKSGSRDETKQAVLRAMRNVRAQG